MSWRHDLKLLGAAFSAVRAAGVVRRYDRTQLVAMRRSFRRFGPTPATLFAISAILHPTKLAIIDDAGSLTYAEVQALAEDFAADLHRRTHGRDGALAILCRNDRAFLIALLAGAQLGRELLLLNTEFTHIQLDQILARHQPAVLIHDDEYTGAVEASSYSAAAVIATRLGRAPVSADSLVDGTRSALPRVRHPVKLTILTSGTTGLAKGVSRAISRRALAELALSTMATARLGPGDVMALSPPFFHGFGILSLVGATAVGASIVCHRRFDTAQVVADIETHGVTVQVGVPVMLKRMSDHVATMPSAPDLSTLRLAISGGAKISPSAVEHFTDTFGPVLANGYGSTEAGLITLATPEDLVRDPHTLGHPILGVSVRILREDRTRAQGSEVGTIFVNGGLGFHGYVNERQPQSARTTTKEVVGQYVSTGDRGYLDAEGRLFLVDREDDMVVSGGENIFPGEVEDALASHPQVRESAVLGIDDAEYGQVLHAFVVLADEKGEITADDLRVHLRHHLERYKQPKSYTFLTKLPRNAMGKVSKSQLTTMHSPITHEETLRP